MSKIKEQLIGYEGNPWYNEQDHVMIDELTEYYLYCANIAEIQAKAREAFKHDLYTTPREVILDKYENMTGGKQREQV